MVIQPRSYHAIVAHWALDIARALLPSRNVVRLEAHDIRDRVCGNKYSTACLRVKRVHCDSACALVANTWYKCELSVRPSDVL